MLDTWPDLPMVDDTLKSLVVVMMREDRVEDVVFYLTEISESSPHFVPTALRAGSWFWSKYLTGKQRLAAWRQAPRREMPDWRILTGVQASMN
jgi:hypothetical protein